MPRSRDTMERVERDTVSSATVKTDNGSKMLPGDKRGLPCEVWAIIFSFLPAEDLCRSAIVCRTWNDLILCLDHTRWKELYMQCTVWRQPNWPLNLHSEPMSWKQAYKEKYIQSNFWTRVDRGEISVSCMSVFKRQKMRKTITVGIDKEHPNLKSALTVANDYDRILVYPGIYDEQFEMSSKIPFELIGVGELGSVILVVCIEQTAITGHISNLVFRAPWFTNFILKVRSGYLQVDNCIMEDGMVYVQNPGSISAHFCTFRHATLILQHVNASIIQNCEFSQTDSAAITVEGYPKEERNWTYQSMLTKMMSLCQLHQPERLKSGETVRKSAFSTAFSLSTATTNKKSLNKKLWDDLESKATGSEARNIMDRKRSCDFDMESHDVETHSCDVSVVGKSELLQGAVGGGDDGDFRHNLLTRTLEDLESGNQTQSVLDLSMSLPYSSSEIVIEDSTEQNDNRVPGSRSFTKLPDIFESQREAIDENGSEIKSNRDKLSQIQSFVSDCAKYSNSAEEGTSDHIIKDVDQADASEKSNKHGESKKSDTSTGSNIEGHAPNANARPDLLNQSDESDVEAEHDVQVPSLDLHSLALNGDANQANGDAQRDDDDDGSMSSSTMSMVQSASSDDTEMEGAVGGYGSDALSTSSDDSVPLSEESEFSSSEESVIMLQCPERHQPRSLSAQKDYSDVISINSQNQSEHIDIIEDGDMKKILNDVRGCFIHKCRITQCKGGVMVSLQAHAIVLECEINSVGYGIRCIQNSRSVILKNEIHHCRTSGVFMRLAASGLVTGNDIHSNCEAGIDIRKNADPVVQCNRIHHGKRSGVVILGSGRGQIKHNDIYQNKEAGVYILYRGNPVVSHNQIYSGKAAGIAVNEGGRGYIHDNTITGNQWGGIDIRHGGDPVIYHNTVCNGISDGIVIGEEGRGSIENNVITGNAGCGVWIMAAHQPLIHGNEIHSNRDSGISLVNKMDTSHKNESMIMNNKDSQSHHSHEFWNLVNDENHHKKRLVTMATVEYNKVYHNNGCGVSVQFGEGVIIQSNHVYANKSTGVFIDQPFPAMVKDNCISCNTGIGLQATCEEKVEIHGNGIYDNKDHGIMCQCETEITENDILGNQSNGIDLKKTKKAKIESNRIYSQSGYGVLLTEAESCDIENNKFYMKSDRMVHTEDGSQCTVTNNQSCPVVPSTKQIEPVGQGHQDISLLGSTRWLLADPSPRPHIDMPVHVAYTPSTHLTTVTRVTIPSENCEQGSKFCAIV